MAEATADESIESPEETRIETATASAPVDLTAKTQSLLKNINSVLVGQQQAVRLAVVAFLAGGHVLIEDVTGV
jgi:MoxR-like ATPase